eukprot:6585388-Pyramimonas_sp.AAC.1
MDIPKAFDFVRHARVLEALLKRGVSESVCAWFLRHMRSSHFKAKLNEHEAEIPQTTRGIPQ